MLKVVVINLYNWLFADGLFNCQFKLCAVTRYNFPCSIQCNSALGQCHQNCSREKPQVYTVNIFHNISFIIDLLSLVFYLRVKYAQAYGIKDKRNAAGTQRM